VGGVLCTLVCKVELPTQTVDLILVAGLLTVDVEPGAIAFPEHVSKLQVLRFEIALHSLHAINSLLGRVCLELHRFELGKHVQVLCPKLAVKFGKSLVLVAP
jgi:hypothetical protein